MDDLGRVRVNDVIYSCISTKLSTILLSSIYGKERALSIMESICDETKELLIEEIISEDHEESILRIEGNDPKDIANEIAVQANAAKVDLMSAIEMICDSSEEEP